MADSSLQDRLRQHAEAFDGLLSLIPAKMYYGNGDDPNEQWQRKKQSRAERKAARLANLDPDSDLNKSVKEIMDERARNKRKLEAIQQGEDSDDDDDDDIAVNGVQKETPGQGLKRKKTDEATEKQEESDRGEEVSERKPSRREEKVILKKQKKLDRKAADAKAKAETPATTAGGERTKEDIQEEHDESSRRRVSRNAPALQTGRTLPADATEEQVAAEDHVPNGLPSLASEEDVLDISSQASTPCLSAHSPTFDDPVPPTKNASDELASTTTSISSTVVPSERPRHIKLPTDDSALRARLAARIEALRAARNADTKPIRTRQELIEARRVKQAERKAHKKELRRQAKLEEERKREEALASARTSPGMLTPLMGIGADGADDVNNHFAFGRVAFGDGAQMSHDLSYVKDGGKKQKGPAASDAKAQLAVLEAQKKRLSGLDEDKRKDVLEKATWLAARRKAEGVKIRDNETLLKKAVKRKERAKKKSEQEWKDRTKGVEKSMKDRQTKREDNIRKRKEDKAGGGGKTKKKSGNAKKGRAGFEGTFGKRR